MLAQRQIGDFYWLKADHVTDRGSIDTLAGFNISGGGFTKVIGVFKGLNKYVFFYICGDFPLVFVKKLSF